MEDTKIELLGPLMRAARLELKMSCREVVNKLPIKVTDSYIYQIERAGFMPAPELIIELAIALKMNVPKTLEIAHRIKRRILAEKYEKALQKYLDEYGPQE